MRTRLPGIRLPAAAALAAAVATLAGCGSLSAGGAAAGQSAASATAGRAAGTSSAVAGSPGGVAGSGTASPSGPAAPGAACTAATVHVRLDTAAAGVAGGTYYVPLEFTNTSSQPCELTGYPAVALTSGVTGQQIGTEAAVDRSVRPGAVLLAPGGVAHAWLGIGDAANFPAKSCHPVTAAGFRVVVPGSESASYLAHRVPACKAPVQGGGILVIRPVQPGAARRGTA